LLKQEGGDRQPCAATVVVDHCVMDYRRQCCWARQYHHDDDDGDDDDSCSPVPSLLSIHQLQQQLLLAGDPWYR